MRFGLGWRAELGAGIVAHLEEIDVLEVLAEDFVDATRDQKKALRFLKSQVPLVVHGTSLGLASTELLRLLNVDIGLILHGEQHYDYYAPVHVGDKITCQQKVTDMYDKKGGALWFVVSETSMKDQAGKLVAKGTGITVVRNPDAAKK